MAGRKRDEKIAVKVAVGIRRQNKSPVRHAGKRFEHALDVCGRVLDGCEHELDAQQGSRGLRSVQVKFVVCGRLRIDHESGAHETRRDVLKHCQPLSSDASLEQKKACGIAAWTCKACDEA